MILRIILFLIFAYFGIKTILAVVRYFKKSSQENQIPAAGRPPITNEMIQDPVCGMYVPMNEAVSHRSRQGTFYFCSEECKKRFLDLKTH
jgi:YHS domain-containing protein